jgi:hypothetical protein
MSWQALLIAAFALAALPLAACLQASSSFDLTVDERVEESALNAFSHADTAALAAPVVAVPPVAVVVAAGAEEEPPEVGLELELEPPHPARSAPAMATVAIDETSLFVMHRKIPADSGSAVSDRARIGPT